jgi:hypothetical protein
MLHTTSLLWNSGKELPVATNLVHVCTPLVSSENSGKELASSQLCSQSRLAHPLMSELSPESQKTLERVSENSWESPVGQLGGFTPDILWAKVSQQQPLEGCYELWFIWKMNLNWVDVGFQLGNQSFKVSLFCKYVDMIIGFRV